MHVELMKDLPPVYMEGQGPVPRWLRRAMLSLMFGRTEVVPLETLRAAPGSYKVAAVVDGMLWAWVRGRLAWHLVSVYDSDADEG